MSPQAASRRCSQYLLSAVAPGDVDTAFTRTRVNRFICQRSQRSGKALVLALMEKTLQEVSMRGVRARLKRSPMNSVGGRSRNGRDPAHESARRAGQGPQASGLSTRSIFFVLSAMHAKGDAREGSSTRGRPVGYGQRPVVGFTPWIDELSVDVRLALKNPQVPFHPPLGAETVGNRAGGQIHFPVLLDGPRGR
jgi:hypothetical protein